MGEIYHINWCRTSSINGIFQLPTQEFSIASLNKQLRRSAASFKAGSSFLMDKLSRRFCPLQAIFSWSSWWQYLAGGARHRHFFEIHFSCGNRKTAAKMLAVWKFLAVLAFIARPGKSQRWWNNWKITPLHSKTSATPTCNYVHVEHHQYCGLHHHDWLVHLRHCLVHQPNWFVQRCHNNGNLEEALQSLGLGCNETSSPSAGPLVHNT